MLIDMIRVAVATQESKKWPTYDGGNLVRWQYISASEASRCVRLLAFDKHEDKNSVPVDDYWGSMSDEEFDNAVKKMCDPQRSPVGRFERGDNVEDWIVKRLRSVEQDYEFFFYLGEDQVSWYHPKHKISGTPDGIYYNAETNEFWLLEFKSTNVPVTTPRAAHLTQVQVNMGLITAIARDGYDLIAALGLDEFGVESFKFAGARILYVGAENYTDMQEYAIEYDEGLTYAKVRSKSAKLISKDGEKIQSPSKLPAEGLQNNGCYFCRHKQTCQDIELSKSDKANAERLRDIIDRNNGKQPAMPTFKSDMPKEEVVELLVKYDQFSEEEKVAKEQKAAIRDGIVAWLKAQKETKVDFQDGDDHIKASLSISERVGKLKRDAVEELIKRVGESLSDYSGKPSTVETLRVSVKKAA